MQTIGSTGNAQVEPTIVGVKKSYPVTNLVQPKLLRVYDGKGPYGEFGSEENLIKHLETLDDEALRKLSHLYEVMTNVKGGWEFTDTLYRDQPQTELDKYVYNLKLCRAVWNRKNVVREQLLKSMREKLGKGGFSVDTPMEIFDLGSGPSDYTIEAFETYKTRYNGHGLPVHATAIDTNKSALERGRKLAKEAGVRKNIDFKIGNMGPMLKYGEIKDADMILTIGIICPLPDEKVMKLFTRSRNALKKGGTFYTCAVRHHPLEKVLNNAGWLLNPREPEYLERMMKEAGYETEIYLDAEEFFVMGLGQKT